jgi:hypothetical protein
MVAVRHASVMLIMAHGEDRRQRWNDALQDLSTAEPTLCATATWKAGAKY